MTDTKSLIVIEDRHPSVKPSKDIRCTVCYQEFSEDEIEGAVCCPACGTTTKPHKIGDDVTIRLNWHELRILVQCVDGFLMLNSTDKARAVVDPILERLKLYKPDGALPLTLIDSAKEALEDHGAQDLIEGGNVKIPEKYFWEIE